MSPTPPLRSTRSSTRARSLAAKEQVAAVSSTQKNKPPIKKKRSKKPAPDDAVDQQFSEVQDAVDAAHQPQRSDAQTQGTGVSRPGCITTRRQDDESSVPDSTQAVGDSVNSPSRSHEPLFMGPPSHLGSLHDDNSLEPGPIEDNGHLEPTEGYSSDGSGSGDYSPSSTEAPGDDESTNDDVEPISREKEPARSDSQATRVRKAKHPLPSSEQPARKKQRHRKKSLPPVPGLKKGFLQSMTAQQPAPSSPSLLLSVKGSSQPSPGPSTLPFEPHAQVIPDPSLPSWLNATASSDKGQSAVEATAELRPLPSLQDPKFTPEKKVSQTNGSQVKKEPKPTPIEYVYQLVFPQGYECAYQRHCNHAMRDLVRDHMANGSSVFDVDISTIPNWPTAVQAVERYGWNGLPHSFDEIFPTAKHRRGLAGVLTSMQNTYRSTFTAEWKDYYTEYQKNHGLTQEGMMQWAQNMLDSEDWKYGKTEINHMQVKQYYDTWQNPMILYLLRHHRRSVENSPHCFGWGRAILAMILALVEKGLQNLTKPDYWTKFVNNPNKKQGQNSAERKQYQLTRELIPKVDGYYKCLGRLTDQQRDQILAAADNYSPDFKTYIDVKDPGEVHVVMAFNGPATA